MDETVAARAEQTQPIGVSSDVVRVRQLVRAYADQLRLTDLERVKAVTAASELARNTLIHGGGGHAAVHIIHAGDRRGLRMTFADKGPGIADLGPTSCANSVSTAACRPPTPPAGDL